MMDVDRSALVYSATATAVLTEVAIWLTAAIMGVAVYEARRTIMGKVKGIFSA
ncbi:hypothetical protein GCM10017044_04370 [Kordiimonas sediminis]|uniref:Uncharacterized protein n=1 Tax=Kordiimonas sediminis TaxID=1735581 RepID=A0A919E4N7_9PROT|nr:hypothetical protein [Kordiimonas sediminis]GHF13462.1 hypothetical protein GCM10017044_04370 [Kordiimonas sediminis]